MRESDVELSALGWFQSLGYALRTGSDIDDAGERADLTRVLLEGRLGAALQRLNPKLPHREVEQVVRTLARPPHPTFVQKNRWFYNLLAEGAHVEYKNQETGETRAGRARLHD